MIFKFKKITHLYLINAKVYYQKKIEFLDIEIKNSKIIKIAPKISHFAANSDVLDCKNYLITPSFFDGHAHTRNPGFEEKEEISTFEVGCLVGGFLDVLAMGNVNPRPSNLLNYQQVQRTLDKTQVVNVKSVGSVTEWKNGVQNLVNFQELVKLTNLFSDDGAPVLSKEMMQQALINAKKYKSSILVHEEHRTNNGVVYPCQFAVDNNISILNQEYESHLVARDIELNRNINAHLHIQHISTPQTIQHISKAKQAGVYVTCEITPHHLCLNNDMIKTDDANFKMNPPLSTKSWQTYLINKFNKGAIDMIVTDHAPHCKHEKKDLRTGMYGIIGTEFCFPCLYTYLIKTKKVPLPLILEKLTTAPAALIFTTPHYIEVGMKAKLVIIDLLHTKKVTEDNIVSKSKNTPLLNKTLQGWPKYLIKNNILITIF
ncbi:dihydroorotase [Mycoplasma sp. SG1]|uniref:dihydroorotase n=1 Tax=Mycoplasma sp. SG1 TaxID=2810348 RepID=UPI002025280E|nr:dihydroorotase [Mycoplasma sp. SG1]URM52824.1 dihydroorotase [Mycoplasma sp. SG1]